MMRIVHIGLQDDRKVQAMHLQGRECGNRFLLVGWLFEKSGVHVTLLNSQQSVIYSSESY